MVKTIKARFQLFGNNTWTGVQCPPFAYSLINLLALQNTAISKSPYLHSIYSPVRRDPHFIDQLSLTSKVNVPTWLSTYNKRSTRKESPVWYTLFYGLCTVLTQEYSILHIQTNLILSHLNFKAAFHVHQKVSVQPFIITGATRRQFFCLIASVSQCASHPIQTIIIFQVSKTNILFSYYKILLYFLCQTLRGKSLLPCFDYCITFPKELQMKDSSYF